MKRVISVMILLSLLLSVTGCGKEESMAKVAELLKRGETEIKINPSDDISAYMSELFRTDVLILGEDINFKYNNSGKVSIQLMPSYKDDFVSRRVKVKNKLDPIVKNDYFKSLDDYAKIKYLHDYVVINVTYDVNAQQGAPLFDAFQLRPESFDIYGAAVEGVAVCRGYAEMLHYLLKEAGFESEIAVGSFKGESHAWNKVKLEGDWLNIDTTVNDTGISYYTYLRSDSELIGYLIEEDTFYTKIPKSVTNQSTLEYYVKSGLVVSSVIEAVELLNEGAIAFRFKGVTSSELLSGLETSNLNLSGKSYAVDGDVFKLIEGSR